MATIFLIASFLLLLSCGQALAIKNTTLYSNPQFFTSLSSEQTREGEVSSVVGLLFNIRSKVDNPIYIIGFEFYTSSIEDVYYTLSTREGEYYDDKSGMDGGEGIGTYDSFQIISTGIAASSGECSEMGSSEESGLFNEDHTNREVPSGSFTEVCPLTIVPREDFDFGTSQITGEKCPWTLRGLNATRSFYITVASNQLLVLPSTASNESFDTGVVASTDDLDLYEGVGALTYPFHGEEDAYFHNSPVGFIGKIHYRVQESIELLQPRLASKVTIPIAPCSPSHECMNGSTCKYRDPNGNTLCDCSTAERISGGTTFDNGQAAPFYGTYCGVEATSHCMDSSTGEELFCTNDAVCNTAPLECVCPDGYGGKHCEFRQNWQRYFHCGWKQEEYISACMKPCPIGEDSECMSLGVNYKCLFTPQCLDEKESDAVSVAVSDDGLTTLPTPRPTKFTPSIDEPNSEVCSKKCYNGGVCARDGTEMYYCICPPTHTGTDCSSESQPSSPTSPSTFLSSSVSPATSTQTLPLSEKATNQPSLSPVVLERTFGLYEITPFIMVLSTPDESQPMPHLRELEEVTSKFLRSIFSDEIGVDNSVYITTLKASSVEESTLQASINVDQSSNNDAAVRRAQKATADTLTYLEVDGIIAIRDLIFNNTESVEQFITATLSSAFQLRDELLGLLQDSSNPFLRSVSMVELSDSIEICSATLTDSSLRCHHGSKCFTGGGEVVVCDCATASPLEAYDGYQCEFSATQFCSNDLTVRKYSFCTNRGECLRSNVTAKEPHPSCICTGNFEGSRCQLVKDLHTDKSKNFVSEQESPLVLRAGDYIIIAIICIGVVLTTVIIVYTMKAGDGKKQIVSNRAAVESNNTSRVAAMEAGLGDKPSVQKVDNKPPRTKGLEEEKEEIVADPEADYEVSATKESQSADNGSRVTEKVDEEVGNAPLEVDQDDSVVAKDCASDTDYLVNPEEFDEEIAAQSKHGDEQGHDVHDDESNSNNEAESSSSQPDENETSKVWEKATAKHGKEESFVNQIEEYYNKSDSSGSSEEEIAIDCAATNEQSILEEDQDETKQTEEHPSST